MENASFAPIKGLSPSAWKALSEKRIYFGHQSVGFNILDGFRAVMKGHPEIKLQIIESSNPSDLDFPVFAHSRVGENGDPDSKIEAFAGLMKKGIGGKADIAFFKFCYMDFGPKTGARSVFEGYRRRMSELERLYPKTTFVHLTIPLTTVQTGWKAWVKRAIGKPISGHADNITRNQFNELLKEEFAAGGRLFDLAAAESTSPDGSRSSFLEGGKVYYSMVPQYTDDGGHLNRLGRETLAKKFLIFLANTSARN